jgi:adenylate cyclase
MIFFGDPETNGEKEDAIRCVLMAIEMRERAKHLGMDIRIGINTGECTVGNFGSEDRMDYTIIGGNVNLASRLESNSEPGKILISQSTYELVKDSIHCESRGNVRVKGIDRDIMTYWVGKQLKQS